MKKTKWKYIVVISLLLALLIYMGYAPLREFYRVDEYKGDNNFTYTRPAHDPSKKTVLLIADNEGTEIFDLLAPFYLFSLTHQANVYIVAQEKYPIRIRKGSFALPHYSYREIDSLNISPAVIVIPRLSNGENNPEDPQIVDWIKSKYVDSTKLLSVCWGSVVAAATGLYDGKPLTSHAIKFDKIKKQFPDPVWQQNVSVTQSGNFYSTAGVSNAVEGSLMVIHDLFGKEVMQAVQDSIRYPYTSPKMEHKSIDLELGSYLTITKKIFLNKNADIGVLLQNNIDEFELASVFDAYHRTFPGSIKTFSMDGRPVTTRHGLTIIPAGDKEKLKDVDELHVLHPTSVKNSELSIAADATIVKYDSTNKEYTINLCLNRIKQQYGPKFENVVRILLDYN
jgi:transcriptional regulator GlxA family with amidase domain